MQCASVLDVRNRARFQPVGHRVGTGQHICDERINDLLKRFFTRIRFNAADTRVRDLAPLHPGRVEGTG